PPTAPPFPYTTLFRSLGLTPPPTGPLYTRGAPIFGLTTGPRGIGARWIAAGGGPRRAALTRGSCAEPLPICAAAGAAENVSAYRSEEHTSELQSLRHL